VLNCQEKGCNRSVFLNLVVVKVRTIKWFFLFFSCWVFTLTVSCLTFIPSYLETLHYLDHSLSCIYIHTTVYLKYCIYSREMRKFSSIQLYFTSLFLSIWALLVTFLFQLLKCVSSKFYLHSLGMWISYKWSISRFIIKAEWFHMRGDGKLW